MKSFCKKIEKTVQMKCGQAYVISIDNDGKELLEVGDVFLPNENEYGTRPYRYEDFGKIDDTNKRVITICTMVGCCYGCLFCSSRRSFKRMLSKDELIGQVEFCISEGLNHKRAESPLLSKEFHVLYTRMGEPMRNADNVIASIYELADKYPHIKIGISTCGIKGGVKKLLDHPKIAPHIMMQFSAHGTDEKTRTKVLEANTEDMLMNLEEIAEFTKKFRKLNPRKVSLNFVLLDDFDYDFKKLRKFFDVEDIYLRLSPLNVTENSNSKNLRGVLKEEDVLYKLPYTSDKLKAIINNAKESGFAYAYAPAIDEEIKYQAACGQALEMLRKERLKTFDKEFIPVKNLIKTYV